MSTQTFNPTFDQVIMAGFSKYEPQVKDEVFEQQHGYPYFLVNFERKNFIIEWDILTHKLTLSVRNQLIGNITLEKAKAIIEELDTPKEN